MTSLIRDRRGNLPSGCVGISGLVSLDLREQGLAAEPHHDPD